MATFVVGVAYILIDLFNSITEFISMYAVMLVAGITVILLLRQTYYQTAKFVLLLVANCLVYVFASNDTPEAGVYIYLIVTNLIALSLFGFTSKGIAIGFCFFSMLLFFMAYFWQIKVLPLVIDDIASISTEEYIKISFTSNFIIGSIVCSMIIYFLLDINHHSEKQIMKKNEELVKTNQELDRFVYSASHDLRAPLSSMLGLINVGEHSRSKEELEQCFAMMKDRIHNMETFIAEIIDYSRNTRQEVRHEEIHLVKIIAEVVDNLKYAQGQGNVEVKFSVSTDLKIISDATRLRVILNNIIGNALKYHDPAKRSPQIEIVAEQKGETVQIEVRDNGIGIPKEYHDRIFEMFFRASETSKGSGLGLYIVKETITKLKGDIRLNSTPGVGSSFFITLPA
jgi:Signal transduction histidine kinase